jgi:plastocyanin/type 1 glutamine amidotransferase/regulation of enolase protein 1 (concanavalin A-like superfamily)
MGTRRFRVNLGLALAAALIGALAIGPTPASAEPENFRVLLYTGTTGFRHTDAINNGRQSVITALENAGYTVDWEDCNGFGTGSGQCQNADKNPRIFTEQNLANYDAMLLFNASDYFSGTGGSPGQLWDSSQENAIVDFVQDGGGIAAVHNSTDMGAGQTTWDWWDGNNANSAVGTTMPGHSANNLNATVMVEDKAHLATKDLPDTFQVSDEHYNWNRNVRGDHHVLANFDERTYNPGSNAMGQDHPASWCRLYDGDNVNDGTGNPKPYNDGRVWTSGIGHNASTFNSNANYRNMVVGGVRWAAGEGKKSDCSGTVWSNFRRTILVSDAHNPIGIDVAEDGKVYWTEIGPTISDNSQGFIKMHDPEGPANNQTTVATIPTRADHGNSEDGVLGMALSPNFATDHNIFVYYSPRLPASLSNCDPPAANCVAPNSYVVGYNLISRFTLNAAGTAVEAGSEREILRVPKVKLSGSPNWGAGVTGNGPGHVGGAGMDFDSEGNLYLGVGDDVAPGESGHSNYPPLDYRAQEHRDARKTSANTGDLRGKVIRITPDLGEIPGGTDPGVGQTYSIPAGNMFAPGTQDARPEIYAMGFRQPFTVHTDPGQPGVVGVGEYCHDNSANGANRAPAGICEWNLLDEPGFQGWPYCMGNNSPANTSFRWDYQNNTSTSSQYDCSQSSIPSDLNYAPAGQSNNPGPTFDGLENIPGPAESATIWKKYPAAANGQSAADYGNLSAGGMQPITGPIYRYDEDAGPNAFPRYYDGSWLIANRGDDSGFWKEVRLKEDNSLLHVHDFLPPNNFGAPNTSLMIGTTFGPDGALYVARFPVGCCRNSGSINNPVQIMKIDFTVQDECLEDLLPPNTSHEVAGQAFPGEEDTYINEATLTIGANDQGCAGVDTIEYREAGTSEWQTYEDPIVFNTAGDYEIEYRATDRMENASEVATASFTVLEIDDTEPPTVMAELSGSQDQRDFYVGSATLSLDADDGETGSGVQTVEYRVDSDSDDDWETYSEPVDFTDRGPHEVDYRATDNVGNTSEVETISFRVISDRGCVATDGSDEFTGSMLGAQWLRHTRNGGTPTEGEMAPFLEDGQLVMRTNDFELDAASGTTSLGPVNFLGIDLPSLGNEWQVETQFTIQHTGGWQHAGLVLWKADNNFFRSTITNNLSSAQRTIYVESSKDNPTTAEGARQTAGGNVNVQVGGTPQPITIKMRYTRPADANSVEAQYEIVAPEGLATDGWVNFPATSSGWINSGGWDLNPAGGVRRDSEGSRIGIIAAGNFPGSSGTNQYNGDPAEVYVDYFRVTGDSYVCEEDAPVTTAALDPADPGPGGTYDGPVDVTLSAADGDDEDVSGVDFTEYRIDGGEWHRSDNGDAAEPFETTFAVSAAGEHLVEFRSTDLAGNAEETGSVGFTIDPGDCVPELSDEFDGSALDAKWNARVEDGEATIEDGQLVLPILDEIDGTRPGPLALVSQQVPEGDWSLTTRVTPDLNTSWAQAGMMLWQSDGNFVKFEFGRNANNGDKRVEIASDDPTDQRETSGGAVVIDSANETMWLRLIREGNVIRGEYAPDEDGEPGEWVEHPKELAVSGVQPVNGRTIDPPREGEGVQLGLYAGSDIDGAPYEQQARFDFARFEPDNEVCEPTSCLSDEFDATALDTGRWSFLHPTTPPTGPGSPSVSDGHLNLPLGSFSLDLERPGPVGFAGQPLPDGDFTLTTEVSAPGLDADDTGQGSQFAQAGLKLFQTDNDWVKIAHTRNAGGGAGSVPTYLEMTYENGGSRTLGDRSPEQAAPAPTVWFRVVRSGDQLSADYSLTDPDQGATWTPLTFGGGSVSSVDLAAVFDSGDGPVYIGPYGGNGSITAHYDYMRFEPDDECEGEDTTPPTTTATLDPAEPGQGGTYDVPVTVILTATDNEGGSGVEDTLYRVDGGAWQPYNLLMPPTVSAPGAHTVDYYSVDAAGNQEDPPGSVGFTIAGGGEDTTAPETEAATDPSGPGPHDGPVDVTLSATDPEEPGGSEPQTHEVVGEGFSWIPDELDAVVGDTVEWDFNDGFHDACLGDDLPGSVNGGDCGEDEEIADAGDSDPGGSKLLTEPGSFTYYCTYHFPSMTGDLTVGEGGGGDPVPGSGVATTTYSIDGGEPVVVENTNGDDPFLTEFTVSEPGEHTVTYFSTDEAGNAEEEKSVSFEITGGTGDDTTPPETTAQINGADPELSYDDPADVALSATDGEDEDASGVASTTYSIDGGSDVVVENTNADDPFETTFTVSEPGEHIVTYFSTDEAGNAEEGKTLTFEISDEEPGGAELDLSVRPRKETVKGRQKATFTATLANVGDEAASDVELCAKAPKRLVELKGKQCAAASSLEPDADMAPEFTFKPTKKARGKKVEITFTATSPDAETVTQTAKLKVKKR